MSNPSVPRTASHPNAPSHPSDPVSVTRTIDGFAVVDARGHTLAVRDSARSAAYAAQMLNAQGEHAAVHLPQRPKDHKRPLDIGPDYLDDPELMDLHSES